MFYITSRETPLAQRLLQKTVGLGLSPMTGPFLGTKVSQPDLKS